MITVVGWSEREKKKRRINEIKKQIAANYAIHGSSELKVLLKWSEVS